MTGLINAPNFDLASTLTCGQAFRWECDEDGWFIGVVGREVWRLRQSGDQLEHDLTRSSRITDPESRILPYLSLDRSLPAILATFPDDPPLNAAVAAHRGLRVLRQEPWETLASFIASSTKRIIQIRQIVAALSQRFGEPIDEKYFTFPSANRVARCTLTELLGCKLGFRAKNLLAAAQAIDSGRLDLDKLPAMELERAREELCKLPGVGEKIASCTLLFSCRHDAAFPIDVWVERSLRRLYFPNKKTTARELRAFTHTYFGSHAGWAQQYLFHAERQRKEPRMNADGHR